jgi:hypothetical protein
MHFDESRRRHWRCQMDTAMMIESLDKVALSINTGDM